MSKLLKVTREDKAVIIRDEVMGSLSTENRNIEYHEAPLKSFDDALQALAPVVKAVMEVPEKWIETIKVKALSVSHTAAGTRNATIVFVRPMAATDQTHRMTTPAVRIDDPADGEEGEREISPAHASAVAAMIEEAERYAKGERQQVLLPLEDNTAPRAEPEQGDVLDFEEAKDPAHVGKAEEKDGPAKKKRKKAKEEERTDWTSEVIPFHPDTDIPDFSKMEKAHSRWYIDQTTQAGIPILQQEIKYNFSKELKAATLAKLKEEAEALLS